MALGRMENPPERPAGPLPTKEPVQPVCKCEFTRLRRATYSNGSRPYVRQCQVCGKTVAVKADKLTFEEKMEATDVDESLKKWWAEKERLYWEQRAAFQRAAYERKQLEWWRDYEVHIKSEAWRRLCDKVLKRANGVCEGCGEGAPSHVHHLTYDHMGNELLFELVALCPACHKRIHPHLDIGPRLVMGERR